MTDRPENGSGEEPGRKFAVICSDARSDQMLASK